MSAVRHGRYVGMDDSGGVGGAKVVTEEDQDDLRRPMDETSSV